MIMINGDGDDDVDVDGDDGDDVFLAACCSWGGVGWQSKQLPCVHNPLDEEEQDKWRGVDCDDY